jgi:hypothetical protein
MKNTNVASPRLSAQRNSQHSDHSKNARTSEKRNTIKTTIHSYTADINTITHFLFTDVSKTLIFTRNNIQSVRCSSRLPFVWRPPTPLLRGATAFSVGFGRRYGSKDDIAPEISGMRDGEQIDLTLPLHLSSRDLSTLCSMYNSDLTIYSSGTISTRLWIGLSVFLNTFSPGFL